MLKKSFFILLILTTLNSYSQNDSLPNKNEIKFDIFLIPYVFSPDRLSFLLSYERHISKAVSISFNPGLSFFKTDNERFTNRFNLISSFNYYPSVKKFKRFYFGLSILNRFNESIEDGAQGLNASPGFFLAFYHETIFTEYRKEWIVGVGPHIGYGIDLSKRLKLGCFFHVNYNYGIVGKAEIHEILLLNYPETIENYDGYKGKSALGGALNLTINYKF